MSTHLTDPAELLDLVGENLGTGDWLQITQGQVNLFADATGDHQWIHTDPERAAAGPFGGTIAHGYLTLSLAPAAISEVLTIDNLTAALNYGLDKVRFPAPVPVGSKLRTTVTVRAARRKPAGLEAVFGLTFEVEGSERPACVADVVVLYR
ncbi:MaoC family dehydratase [Nocardia puris]|uniref:Acyl dehydratase n=1 Tax=Nocardia puris TaxID=208602 RepID=A0A366D669_9NOCA|nr:MaoC family dehydratase [Nocardia puris]MBF6212213.1 MaoC family dehydratase [Nocardia puris]MBF6370181.1 MaoC family dehydratase [Nocardia puris]MBF6460802.1 MaoC family dehydratase [Nocardia puris]RBO85466.1 acyl dehydratase [Nocardia puris]